MFFISIILQIILISSIQSLKPTLKLTFNPNEKYFKIGDHVNISCELLNPIDHTESPQLWYVDVKTGKLTPITRSLLHAPSFDAPNIFKQNNNKRLQYVRKNHMRIKHLQLNDSARYICNCPDCEEHVKESTRALDVMKLVEPKWHIEPDFPVQEHAKTILKCTANDFYPYLSHKIIRGHQEITFNGKSVIPLNNTYPQKFSWEAVVTPTADWHRTTVRCIVLQGNTEQHAITIFEVLFTPRFLICHERQYVNSMKENASIECAYSGHPAPKLIWLRQKDEKPITSGRGITIEVHNETHGQYKSTITLDPNKLIAASLTSTIESLDEQTDIITQPTVIGENYYQQLLSGGFIARLVLDNEVKDSRKINIITDVSQEQSNPIASLTIKTRKSFSTTSILFSFVIILYMVQQY